MILDLFLCFKRLGFERLKILCLFVHIYCQTSSSFHCELRMEIFSDPSTVLLVTLIALVFTYFNYKLKRSSPFRGKNLPPGSYGLPLIGETISFVRAQTQNKTVQWIQDRVNKHGPVFKTSILGSKVAIVTGQAGNRFVFNGGDGALSLKQPKSVTKILGKYSLFEITGPRHKLIRSAIAAFVTPESIQRYLGEMESLIQKRLFKVLNYSCIFFTTTNFYIPKAC